jgi:hypothetical protein
MLARVAGRQEDAQNGATEDWAMPIIVRDRRPLRPPPQPPQAWPYSSEPQWRAWRAFLEDATFPLAASLRVEADRELERISRCRSEPVRAMRHPLIPARTRSQDGV